MTGLEKALVGLGLFALLAALEFGFFFGVGWWTRRKMARRALVNRKRVGL